MKKKILLSTFFVVITLVVGITVSCNKEDLQLQTQKEYLSITQAKTAFENELLSYGIDENSDLLAVSASVADNASERYLATFELSPGEYTPQWDRSIICRNSNFEAVNTPLTVQYVHIQINDLFAKQGFG